MTYKINQKLLAEIAGLTARVSEKRASVPIAECLKICFSENGFSVAATNFDIWIQITTPGFKPKDCAVAIIPAKQFTSVISNLKDQEIDFTVNDKRLTVKTDSSQYKFGTLPLADWPDVQMDMGAQKIIINSDELSRQIGFVYPCISTESTRYYLNGVNIRSEGNNLRFEACDGHRGAISSLPLATKFDAQGIVPREAVALLIDLLDKIAEEVDVSLELSPTKTRLNFKSAYSVSVISRLIEGNFPDLDRLVPHDRENNVYVVPRTVTMEALHRMLAFSDEKKGSAVKFEFAKGKVVLSAVGENGDTAEESIKIDVGTIENIIGMNGIYANSMLGSFASDKVKIYLSVDGRSDPIAFTAPDGELALDAKALSFMMPIRI